MLVLSRKKNETIVFPNLGISVEILRVAGKSVSVGVRAPEKLRILRGELAEKSNGTVAEAPELLASSDNHALRNRLNKASLALHLAQKQLQVGKVCDAEQSMATALDSLAELDQLAAAEESPVTSPRIESKSATEKPRALLVEDDANERELLAAYLRLSGYEVEAVEDGVLAVEYLRTQKTKPAVVVMDMQMPRMNGRQTVNAIRENPEWNQIQLIVVSGTKQADMGVPSGDRGISRWFEKPLKPDDLVSHLSELN